MIPPITFASQSFPVYPEPCRCDLFPEKKKFSLCYPYTHWSEVKLSVTRPLNRTDLPPPPLPCSPAGSHLLWRMTLQHTITVFKRSPRCLSVQGPPCSDQYRHIINAVPLVPLIITLLDQRDGSVVKSPYCFCREPKFGSHHLQCMYTCRKNTHIFLWEFNALLEFYLFIYQGSIVCTSPNLFSNNKMSHYFYNSFFMYLVIYNSVFQTLKFLEK